MNYLTLKNLLSNNPTALTGMTADQKATWCNTLNSAFTKNVLVPLSTLQAWLMNNGIWSAIVTAAQSSSNANYVLASEIIALQASRLENIDMTATYSGQLLSQMVSASLITSAQEASIKALGTQEQTPAESVGLPTIRPGDVQIAEAF